MPDKVKQGSEQRNLKRFLVELEFYWRHFKLLEKQDKKGKTPQRRFK